MAKLDKKFAPYVEDAKQDFVKRCNDMDDASLSRKKIDMKIRYFDILSEFYEGDKIDYLAAKYFCSRSGLRHALNETQNRIRLFLLENN